MHKSTFPVQSSVLSPAALAERELPHYPAREPIACRLVARSINDTYQITTSADTFYLRVSGHGWRTREDLEAELALVRVLGAHDLSVAPPVPRDDGALLTSLPAPEGERFAVRCAEAPGASMREISP